MISIVYNEIQRAIEIHLDTKGADLLIRKLQHLRSAEGHVHLYSTDDDRGLCTKSPYQEKEVYGELILNLLPSDAWEDMGPT
jgi:hypothetical protein